jgi:hypothetical protein
MGHIPQYQSVSLEEFLIAVMKCWSQRTEPKNCLVDEKVEVSFVSEGRSYVQSNQHTVESSKDSPHKPSTEFGARVT